MHQAFPPGVTRRLKWYVYRLIDPRNGETFYVGKGRGNRLFAHVNASIDSDDPSDKLCRIRDITNSGLQIGHVIHRHGMDENTAFEVEAALIDAYPGLTNEVVGFGSNDFGAMHADEIIRRYEAKEADFKHKLLMINVNRSSTQRSLYDATRYAWKISVKRAKQADYVLAVQKGIILNVFTVDKWLPATPENFPGRDGAPGRYGFIGSEAPHDIQKQYLQRRVPDKYRQRGAANPIKYTYS